MGYTTQQLQTLRSELQTDPLARGYAGKSHEQLADMLAVEDRQADRDTLDVGILVASIVKSEYQTLTANEKDYLRLLAMVGSLPLTATVRTELAGMFPPGSATRANLVALLKRSGARTDELGLPRATTSDVANALR